MAKPDTRDLYDDPSIANDEVLKPLTAVPNEFAPPSGIHLFQFCGSFFSCEARLILEEKGADYTSHDICIAGGVYDQYRPEYVRINRRCVVPTIVVDGKVTTDAHNMIAYADEAGLGGPTAPRLIPEDPKEKALAQEYFDLAAGIFIEALSYGEVPGGPKIPWPLTLIMKGNHESKREALQKRLEMHCDDPYLRSAYEAKLRLLNRQISVLDSGDNLEIIAKETKEAIGKLNEQLVNGPAKDGTSWLCGQSYSHADMLWALTLHRLGMRGYKEYMWGTYPAVDAYADRLIARPVFQRAVVSFQTKAVLFRNILPRKLAKALSKPSTLVVLAGIAIPMAILLARQSK